MTPEDKFAAFVIGGGLCVVTLFLVGLAAWVEASPGRREIADRICAWVFGEVAR